MNIVILAAGMGKRMNSRLPKVLQPLAGKPMLRHVVEKARQLNPSKLIVVIGHGADAVRDAFVDASDITFVMQEKQLGTGHALMQALPLCDLTSPTLVLLGDVPLIEVSSLRRLIDLTADGLGLLTVCLEDPTGYGRIVRENGQVQGIVEQKDATEKELLIKEVNTGIMLLPTQYLDAWLGSLKNENAQGEYYLTDVIGMAVQQGIKVVATQAGSATEVEGVNNKVQLARLERAYQRQKALGLMRSGVTLLDPDRIDVRGELVCGKDVEIDVGCIFVGKVKLADGVKVGAYCTLKDVEVGAGTEILPYCHFDGAKVGENVRLGPYSRLRPGAVLADETHIGNFVEIKKSNIGFASKVNHLSYIGDTDMGARVNIGAGTITCNYDGVNKFRTTIGDDAFIGSDTQLVAPVTVGKGATLGAGTTLTKNAPDDKLTLSRARQVTVEGWKRPTKKK